MHKGLGPSNGCKQHIILSHFPPRKVIFSLSASISQDLLRVGASGALIHKLNFQSGYLKLWIFTMAPVQFLLGGSNTGHLWDVYPGESWHSRSALSPNLYLHERPFESDHMIPTVTLRSLHVSSTISLMTPWKVWSGFLLFLAPNREVISSPWPSVSMRVLHDAESEMEIRMKWTC